MPAQSSGATAAGSRFAGTFSAKCSSTTSRSEYPPCVMPFPSFSRLP
ncbi:hypothetical protein COEX109129_41700 [Corallococcus exiguus]